MNTPVHTGFWCELCDGPATENDWSMTAQMVVCPACLERMLENATADEPRSEMGMARGGL